MCKKGLQTIIFAEEKHDLFWQHENCLQLGQKNGLA
jgi:hypothetical protein